MKSENIIIHQQKVFAYFSENDLKEILINYLSEKEGFDLNKDTEIKFFIGKKDKCGTAGFENYAEITLINDL